MTIKEFLENNPEAVKRAAECKTVDEFKTLAEGAGIIFENEEKVKEAFELIKNHRDGALSDDDLDAVSGGSQARQIRKSEIFHTPDGTAYVNKIGDKA